MVQLLLEILCIFGGKNHRRTYQLNDLHRYDLNNNKWEEVDVVGDKPLPRRYINIVSKDNVIYLFGGRDEEERFNDLWKFDIGSSRWFEINAKGIKPKLRSAQTLNILGNSIYVFGGNTGNSSNELFEFHISTETWKEIEVYGEFLKERYWNASAITEKNELFIQGGWIDDPSDLDSGYFIELPSRKENMKSDIFKNFCSFQDTFVSFN
eukprot:gene2529-3234_t